MSFFGFFVILLGIIYGYSRKGSEDYWGILKKGLIIGLVIGLIISIIGSLIGGLLVGIVGGFIGGLLAGIGGLLFVITALVITIEFVVGALLGDIIEKALK